MKIESYLTFFFESVLLFNKPKYLIHFKGESSMATS